MIKTIFRFSFNAVVFLCLVFPATFAQATEIGVLDTLRTIENRIGGRIGVSAHQPGTGRSWQYRADERFPLSSTFKPFACAALLTRVDQKTDDLARIVTYSQNDLVTYSPVTTERLDREPMSLADLCEATITLSDNTAGNLILKTIGGPAGLTEFMRSIGDPATRLDRWETTLNEGTPGDLRDTTTPNAAAASLRTLLSDDTLSSTSRQQLRTWMHNDKVADALIRSVLPEGWQIADKTGAGGYGSRSLIAMLWSPTGDPVVIAIYMTENTSTFADRNAAIAEIGAALLRELTQE